MLSRIGMLDVEQHHVGLVENGIELLGVVGIERIAAAVQAGMHAAIGVVALHGTGRPKTRAAEAARRPKR